MVTVCATFQFAAVKVSDDLSAFTSGSLPACLEIVTVTFDVGAAASLTVNDALPPSGTLNP